MGSVELSIILGVEKKYSSEEIIDAILEVAPNRKEDIMTAAQQPHTERHATRQTRRATGGPGEGRGLRFGKNG